MNRTKETIPFTKEIRMHECRTTNLDADHKGEGIYQTMNNVTSSGHVVHQSMNTYCPKWLVFLKMQFWIWKSLDKTKLIDVSVIRLSTGFFKVSATSLAINKIQMTWIPSHPVRWLTKKAQTNKEEDKGQQRKVSLKRKRTVTSGGKVYGCNPRENQHGHFSKT